MARFEITSLTFMLVCVPLPVCQMRSGKWSLELAGDDFVGGLDDQLGFVGGELAEVLVHERGGFFQDAEGANQLGRHGVFADVEVMQRALRLSAPVAVVGTSILPMLSDSMRVGCSVEVTIGKLLTSARYADAEFRKRTENYSNASARGVFCDTGRCDQPHDAKLASSYAVRCFRGSV